MDQKNRTILVIAIAVTVVAAVFVSIVLPAITGRAPQVTLPNVNQETEGESQAFLPVEVTPETVQTVISSLSRPDSYYRELTVTLFWEGGESAEQVEIWADGGYVRTTIATGGTVQYRLVGEGKLRLWYAGDQTWQETEAGDGTADLAQRIPTYEDVLDLHPADYCGQLRGKEREGLHFHRGIRGPRGGGPLLDCHGHRPALRCRDL